MPNIGVFVGRNLPIGLDGHFITNVVTDPISHSIVTAINDIGHVMGISTIAELKTIGIDYVQGYGVHKPELLEALLSGKSVARTAVLSRKA